jgi:hypothetical protein
MDDLEEAIDHMQQAVAVTPNGHSDNASRLNNLGNMLAHRYKRSLLRKTDCCKNSGNNISEMVH